jgi:retron-type reverse transcriptase
MLGKLLLELKKLLDDPEKNRTKIEQMLRRTRRGLIEYEVLRFYASSKGVVPKDFEDQMRSRDPRVRRDAVAKIDLFFPRARAGRYLRMVTKDPDAQTRATAFRAIRKLALTDSAIPDTRYHPKKIRPMSVGGWNPTGWLFGLHRRKVKSAGKPAEITKKKLPALANDKDVMKLLDIADATALKKLCRAGVAAGSPYVEFEIEKSNGKKRPIAAPRAPLRKIQRTILRQILDKIALHDAAHGFVKGRSTVTNAKPHEKAFLVVKLDLVDFFPTMHFRRVRGVFNQIGYSEKVSHTLAALCTYRPVLDGKIVAWPGVLPQGAPTSPALANICCRRMDARLTAMATRFGGRYTRYADDLTFSFDAEPKALGRFLWWVDQICQQEGFSENARKRRILRNKTQQRVTGIVVNSGLSIPRRDRRRFRAILTNVKKNGLEKEARGKKDFAAYLRGFAAYVKMVQPALGKKWVAEVKALTKSK